MVSATKRAAIFLALGAFTIGAAAVWAGPQDAKGKGEKKDGHAEVHCPVMAKDPIDLKVFTRYQGKRVYFCCKDCVGEFEKDPTKFADAVRAQWKAMPTMRVQTKCPVTGGKIDMKVFHAAAVEDIYFADKDALAKYEKDPAAYAKALDDSFTYQTTCPVSGKDIKTDKFVEDGGKKVYFCCDGCPAAFKKDSAKYSKMAEEQIAKNKAAFAKHGDAMKEKP